MSADHVAAVYAMLVRAAENGAPAPKNAEIAAALGFSSMSVGARCVATLERQELIRVARFNAGRIVTIAATGVSTAAPVNKTPHWRQVSRALTRAQPQRAPASAGGRASPLAIPLASDPTPDERAAAASTPHAVRLDSRVSLKPAPEQIVPVHAPAPFSGRGVATQPRWRMSAWLHAARARPRPRKINIALTAADKCQWIENESWPYTYCGAERAGKLPYCSAHAERAYIKEEAEEAEAQDPPARSRAA